MKTRVRFAPSPTGPLHIGGLRTALFNYLYAKKNKGVFILRMEDTDQNRYVDGSEVYIQESLEWCGLLPDEGPNNGGNFGPYRQSERKSLYEKYIQILINNGSAYYAYDSPEELAIAREKSAKKGETFVYGSQNRHLFKNSLTKSSIDKDKIASGKYVIRLKVEPECEINVFDEIRGAIKVSSDLVDDKILMKADGMPTYHFANVVDDKLMKISTVIRGEEWLPSLPLHKLIYDAFGWEAPKFMHLPLILKPNGGGKLSKRDGDKGGYPVFPIKWNGETTGFRESGFLSKAVVNYLALLGWNNGDEREIFSLSELVNCFNSTGIQKGGARFDYEKAKWINHQYIAKTNTNDLLQLPETQKLLKGFNKEKQFKILALVKERIYTLEDLKNETSFIIKPFPYDEKSVIKLKKNNSEKILNKVIEVLKADKEITGFKEELLNWASQNKVNIGTLMQSLRLSFVGRLTGPDVFDICTLLGKDVSLKRVQRLLKHLSLSK